MTENRELREPASGAGGGMAMADVKPTVGRGARPEAATLAEAMQAAWDDFVADTGCFPDCFEWHGGRGVLAAHFDRGNFAASIASRLTPQSKLGPALAQLHAIEQRLASERAALREEFAGMSTADLVVACLNERDGEIQTGWDYANVVERDAAKDRDDRDAEIERLKGLLAEEVRS